MSGVILGHGDGRHLEAIHQHYGNVDLRFNTRLGKNDKDA